MSHRRAIFLLLAGAVAGGWAGLGYLDDDGRCTGIVESTVACRINHAWLPFIGMIVVGMLAALAVAALVSRVNERLDRGTAGRTTPPGDGGDPHGLEGELRHVALNAGELGLERSGEPGDVRGRGSGEAEPVRIGQRGRPVPRPRRAG